MYSIHVLNRPKLMGARWVSSRAFPKPLIIRKGASVSTRWAECALDPTGLRWIKRRLRLWLTRHAAAWSVPEAGRSRQYSSAGWMQARCRRAYWCVGLRRRLGARDYGAWGSQTGVVGCGVCVCVCVCVCGLLVGFFCPHERQRVGEELTCRPMRLLGCRMGS